MKLDRFRNYISAILDLLYGILKIQFKIRNQPHRKPLNTELCGNRRDSKISCPPYWIRYCEKWKTDVKFVISDLKSLGVQSSAKIVAFPKFYVGHIGSPFLIPKIPCQIHNQRPQKLPSTEFCGNRVVSKTACPTYSISAI